MLFNGFNLAITSFIILIISIFYIRYKRNFNYWKDRNISFVKGNLLFGSIKDVLLNKITLGELYQQFYRSYPESEVIGFFKLQKPALLIKSPDVIKSVLVTNFENFNDNDFHISFSVDPLIGLNPFVNNGEKWKKYRKILTASLTSNKLKFMLTDINNIADDMLAFIDSKHNELIEAKLMAGLYTMSCSARCSMGINENPFISGSLKDVTEGKVFTSTSNAAILGAIVAPWIIKKLKIRLFSKNIEEYFLSIVRETKKYRKTNKVSRNDLMQLLLDKPDEEMNDKEISGHLMTFFLNGYETSSILLSFALYEIGLKTEIQEQLLKEINKTYGSTLDDDVNKLLSLEYLEMVVNETLRMHPPLQAIVKVCTKSHKFHLNTNTEEILIESNTPVHIPILALHYDSKYYENPHSFQPNRFYNKGSEIVKFTFIPFGEGPRMCLGLRFALMMVKMGIVSILRKYRIESLNKYGQSVKLDPSSSFTRIAKDGLWLRFHKL